MAKLKVEGMELYYNSTSPELMGCIESLENTGETVTAVEEVCIGAKFNKQTAGKFELGTASFTIALDPTSSAHEDMKDAYEARDDVEFCICHSDGDAAPSYSGGTWTASDRTITYFTGFLTAFPESYPDNDNVKVEIEVQKTGLTVRDWVTT